MRLLFLNLFFFFSHLIYIKQSTFGMLLHFYSELQSLRCNDKSKKTNIESQMVQIFENK